MINIHGYYERDIDYLLKFQNPLELVADYYQANLQLELNDVIAEFAHSKTTRAIILLCRRQRQKNRSDDNGNHSDKDVTDRLDRVIDYATNLKRQKTLTFPVLTFEACKMS